MRKIRVGVVVLGDLGRSPRMQYHVQSLASHGYSVDFIGYQGTPVPDTIRDQVTVRHVRPVPGPVARLPRLWSYLVKTVWQVVALLLTLPLFSHLDYILVQTPPGVPTLPVLWLYCLVKVSSIRII